MTDWLDIAGRIEPLEDARLDAALVRDMQSRRRGRRAGISFYTPTFKAFSTAEIASHGSDAWPAVSVTGGECRLQCDHCRARILEAMIPATTPDALRRVAEERITAGARGMLLTGGSDARNEVPYDPFYPVIRRIRDDWPDFRIAVHTALVDGATARRMEDSGIDVAMMDVIGARDTIRQVYHLKREVEDFERTLEALVTTRMKIVPHIVLGLHYGRMLGEWNALDVIRRHPPSAVVLVVVMPFYAPTGRPFAVPSSAEVGGFFLDAREALPGIPLMLGCARPAGRAKSEIDAYAVLAGLDGIAHPSEGVVELAVRLGHDVRVAAACCSLAVGQGLLEGSGAFSADVERLIEFERAARGRRPGRAPGGIRVVAAEQGR